MSIILVAVFVSPELLEPIVLIAIWLSSMPTAAVPETSVHKHNDFLLSEYEIRPADDPNMPPPAGDAIGT